MSFERQNFNFFSNNYGPIFETLFFRFMSNGILTSDCMCWCCVANCLILKIEKIWSFSMNAILKKKIGMKIWNHSNWFSIMQTKRWFYDFPFLFFFECPLFCFLILIFFFVFKFFFQKNLVRNLNVANWFFIGSNFLFQWFQFHINWKKKIQSKKPKMFVQSFFLL